MVYSDGILILSTILFISLGGSAVNFITIIDTIKLTNIAIVPNPSGEILNHH
jgi:hypothetical protein